MNNLDKNYWNHIYHDKHIANLKKDDPMVHFIDKYIPVAKGGEECYEIGCFPCGYLSYVGMRKQYRVSGIDYCDNMNDQIASDIIKRGVSVGEIKKGNFFDECKINEKKYKLVYSFGFVEHFKNYKKVISLHDKYVSQGGYLIITAPNYRGKWVYLLHRFFDYDNLKIHNIASMNPKEWKDLLQRLGYEIEFCGYFGGFLYAPSNDMIAKDNWKAKLWISVGEILKFLSNKVMKESEDYSSFCGIVAIKK